MSHILEQKLTNLITPRASDATVNTKFKNENFYSNDFCDLIALLNENPSKPVSDSIITKLYDFLMTSGNQTIRFNLPTYEGYKEFTELSDIMSFLEERQIKFSKDELKNQKNQTDLWNVTQQYIRAKKIEIIESLNAIIAKAFIKETELGSCFLYIGHFFLKGSFSKGIDSLTEINAPLMMTAVKAKIINNETITFEKRETSYNSRLFLFLEKHNLGNYPYISLAGDSKLDDGIYDNLVSKVKHFFNRNAEEMNVLSNNFTTRSRDSRPIPFKLIPAQTAFEVDNNIMLMFIEPKGGAIKSDVSKIKSEDNLDQIFRSKIFSTEKDLIKKKLIKNETSLYQIGRPLNFSQQVAATSTLHSDTVIFGPPGTGKSETIATIIANFLALQNSKGETNKILMVSSKKAALDVIEERLFSLSNLVLPGFETDPSKINLFYNKIINLFELLQEERKPTNLLLSNEMQNYTTQLANIHRVLNKKDYSENTETDVTELLVAFEKINPTLYLEMENTKLIQDINILLSSLTSPPTVSTLSDLFTKFREELTALNTLKQELTPSQFENLFVKIWPHAEQKEMLMTALNNNYSESSINNIKISIIMGALINCEFSSKIDNNLIEIYNSTTSPLKMKVSKVIKFLNTLYSADISYIDLCKLARVHAYNAEDLKLFITIQKWLKLLAFGKLEDLKNLDINGITKNYYKNISSKKIHFDELIFNNYISDLQSRYRSLPEGEELKQKQSDDVLTKRKITNLISMAKRNYKLPVNTFLKRFQRELLFLFPVWILNPIQVSSATPCEPDLFDVGIFDEASQMFLEQAYPILYRVKRKVVAGDDKQMKPVAHFMNVLHLSEEDKMMDENGDLAESLLDKAKTCGWETHFISNHYRSDQDSNIKFVNKWIYDNNLSIVSKNSKFENDIQTIFLENNFIEDGAPNELEVNTTIQQIILHHKQNQNEIKIYNDKVHTYNSMNPDKEQKVFLPLDSIMVICFNNKQQELLDKKLNDVNFMQSICSPNFQWKTIDERKLKLLPKKIPAKPFKTKIETQKFEADINQKLQQMMANKDTTAQQIFEIQKKRIINFVDWNINFEPLLAEIEIAQNFFELSCILLRYGVTNEELSIAANKTNNAANNPTTTTNIQNFNFTIEDGVEVRERFLKHEIKVRNLDNVQGSEADLVIISTNTAPKQKESSRTLSFQKYKLVEPQGRYSLNVAITRAKKKTIVIKSFKIGSEKWELQNKPRTENIDWNTFYEWINFVEHFENNKSTEIKPSTEILDPIWQDIYTTLNKLLSSEQRGDLLFCENCKLGNFDIDFMIYNRKKEVKEVVFLKNTFLNRSDYNLIELVAFNDKIQYLKDRGYQVVQIIPFFYRINRTRFLKSIASKITRG